MITAAGSNPYDIQLGDTAINHTKVYNLVELAENSVAIMGISPRTVATVGLVASLSFILMGFSFYVLNREKLGSVAVCLSMVVGISFFFVSTSTSTEQEALKMHAEEVHREILEENQYDMDHYVASEVRQFRNDGKEVRWKDTRTGKVAFTTIHAHSTHVRGIAITSFDGSDISTFRK